MIHLLNTRSSFFLEVVRDSSSLSNAEVNKEINYLFDETVEKLRIKNIQYEKLRSALIPSGDHKEIVFIFDSDKTSSNWYGREIFSKLIPLLRHDNILSMRVGDILSHGIEQDILYSVIFENAVIANSSTFKCSEQYFAVYVNHISDVQLQYMASAPS